MRNFTCEACNSSGISSWAWLYAGWPFYARCRNCRARYRARSKSLLLELFTEPFGVLLIVGGLYKSSIGPLYVGTLVLVLGLVVLLAPHYFGRLDRVS
jgi:hypothetical protein